MGQIGNGNDAVRPLLFGDLGEHALADREPLVALFAKALRDRRDLGGADEIGAQHDRPQAETRVVQQLVQPNALGDELSLGIGL